MNKEEGETFHKGGFVSDETVDLIVNHLKIRPSWWIVDGKFVHCTSNELKFFKGIGDK